jgi:hypothetical protein
MACRLVTRHCGLAAGGRRHRVPLAGILIADDGDVVERDQLSDIAEAARHSRWHRARGC